MYLLDSGSSLFLTPNKDALILGIKTVMNIRGVGGDVAKIKSPLFYTFLDIKGEYVGFHYQSLYLLESLPIPLFATGPAEQQMWSFLLGPSSPCAGSVHTDIPMSNNRLSLDDRKTQSFSNAGEPKEDCSKGT
jgi:hypothetical protein